MYIGTMVQGRQTVISYKVHDKVAVPEDEWYIVEDTHEPVVDKETFEKSTSLQKRETRAAPEKRELHLFSGFIRCADCKKAMTRQKTKNIVYYYCRTFREKSKNLCTKHTVKENDVIQVTLAAIQKQIELVSTISEIIEEINKAPTVQNQSTRLTATLKQRKAELEKITSIIDSLYGDWKSGDITKAEYHRMKSKYELQADQFRQVIQNITEECNVMAQGITTDDPYLMTFLKYRNITSLERSILVDLVNNIYVYEGGAIGIEFSFSDQHQRILEYIENNRSELVSLGNQAIKSA